MKVKALAPWFGSKRTLAPRIVEELGEHTQYFEPFCGSMAVLLAKEPSQKETANDLHGDLINLARVVADTEAAPKLYERLQQAIVCEDLLNRARYELDDMSSLSLLINHKGPAFEHSIERAYWYFLASWQGRNGTAGTRRVDYQIAVRWTKSGGSPTVRWRNAVESLPAWHRRLQNVVILSRDAFRILDRFEDVPQTAIYVDPPYIDATRSGYRRGSGSDHKYLHEFNHGDGRVLFDTNDEDQKTHERLAKLLRSYQHARIVVSYYDCPRVRELYSDWTIVEHTMHKHLHSQAGRGARPKVAPEILLINGPSNRAKGSGER